jgi:hypothetical protein
MKAITDALSATSLEGQTDANPGQSNIENNPLLKGDISLVKPQKSNSTGPATGDGTTQAPIRGAQNIPTSAEAPFVRTAGGPPGAQSAQEPQAPKDIGELVTNTPDLGNPRYFPVLTKFLTGAPPLDISAAQKQAQILTKDADRLDRAAQAIVGEPEGLRYAAEADRRRTMAEKMLEHAQRTTEPRKISIPGTAAKVQAIVAKGSDGQERVVAVEDKRTVDKDLAKIEPQMSQFWATTQVLGEFAKDAASTPEDTPAKQTVRKVGQYLQTHFGLDVPDFLGAPPGFAINVATWQHNVLGITALMPAGTRGVQAINMFQDLAPKPGDSKKIQFAKVDASNLQLQVMIKSRVETTETQGNYAPPNLKKIYNYYHLQNTDLETLVTEYVAKARATGGPIVNPFTGESMKLSPDNKKTEPSAATFKENAKSGWTVQEVE